MPEKKYRKALFVFRRDLRLHDNTGLIEALRNSGKVIPCFIFDPRQVEKNSYRSTNAVQFMIESLKELDSELRKLGSHLYVFQGTAENIVQDLIAQENIEAIFVNRDYTPFSCKRDERIRKIAKKERVDFHSWFDLLLTEVGTVLTGQGTPYTIYSYFAKKAALNSVPSPQKNAYRNYFKSRIPTEVRGAFDSILPVTDHNPSLFASGGRTHALKILKKMEKFSEYDQERNIPAISGTTGLSAHNKFGTVSPREVYHSIKNKLGTSHTLIRELYWRDFFTHVAFHFPHVFQGAFHQKYDKVQWENDKKKFKAWCEGFTGYPIVDAGMRELNQTGFMHNRVRMIVASFLVKDLHIDWRWGEKYFAQQLVDYDPAVNNGNWQWAASTGCDAQPYFRVFNPWIQAKKFDPETSYIKRWVPELKPFDAKQIHGLENGNPLLGYVPPIVEHAYAKEIAIEMFSGH